MTYQDILDAEYKIEATRENYEFRRAINEVLAAAEDNARDDQGRIDSIVSLLSFSSNYGEQADAVVTWFAELGIVA